MRRLAVLLIAAHALAIPAANAQGQAKTDGGKSAKQRRAAVIGHGRVLRRPPIRSAERLRRLNERNVNINPAAARPPRKPPRPPFRERSGDPAEDPFLPPGGRADEQGVPGSPGAGNDRGGVFATAALSTDFSLFRSQAVAQGSGITSQVAEPSWANDRNAILYTGNWHAAVSPDNGINWSFLDPDTYTSNLFCCDQVAIAADRGGHSLVFWLMQLTKTDGRVKLLVFDGRDELLSQSDYCTREWDPTDFGFVSGTWFDFNNIATSNDHLYISSNAYKLNNDGTSTFQDGVVWRLALDDMDDDDCAGSAHYWKTAADYSTALVQGAGSTMYWAYHGDSNDDLEIWSVPDSSTTATNHDVEVSSYTQTGSNTGDCPVPDGSDPCDRLNDRMSTGYFKSGEVGFFWNVSQGDGFPYPHIRGARVSTSSWNLIDEPDIWNDNYAWVYPAVAPNDDGNVGMTLYRIGGGSYPRSRITLIDDVTPSWDALTMNGVITSSHGADENKWGDYGGVRPYGDCRDSWGGGVWSMQGGASDADAEHRFTWFGRERAGCVDLTITALTAVDPGGLRVGDTFVIDSTTRNTGSATSVASITRYYLSRDADDSSDDLLIAATSAIGALSRGSSAADGVTASVPSGASGSYYVIACADDTELFDEISDTNNCFADDETVSVSRALIGAFPRGIAVPAQRRMLGAQLQFDGRFASFGAPGAQVASWFLDSGTKLSARSVMLGTQTLRFPAAGAAQQRPPRRRPADRRARMRRFRAQHRFTAPRALRQGHYHVIVCVTKRRMRRPPANACLPSRKVVHLHGRKRG